MNFFAELIQGMNCTQKNPHVFLTGIHFPAWFTEQTHKSQRSPAGELEEAAYTYTNAQKRTQNYSSSLG